MLALAFLGISLFSVLKPGTNWPHYFLFLHWPVTFLLAVLLATAVRIAEAGQSRLLPFLAAPRALLLCALVFLACASLRDKLRNPVSMLPSVRCAPSALTHPVTRRLVALSQSGDRVAVWGYMPQVSTWSGLLPGVRDFQTHYAVLHRQHGDYLEAFCTDMESAKPEFFVDAVAPRTKYLRDRARYAHENYPAVAAFVGSHYRLVAEAEGMRVYERDDLAAHRRLGHQ